MNGCGAGVMKGGGPAKDGDMICSGRWMCGRRIGLFHAGVLGGRPAMCQQSEVTLAMRMSTPRMLLARQRRTPYTL